MNPVYQHLKIFISCPSDLKEEKEFAEEVVNLINDSCADVLNLYCRIVSWEKFPPCTHPSEETIQDILNNEITNCNIFLLCLYKRYGSMEYGWDKSNTEREIDIALDELEKKKKITFLSYFREIPKNLDRGPQQIALENLEEKLKNKRVWYKEYKDPSEFKDYFTHDLYQTLIKFRLSTKKDNSLKTFWKLGATSKSQPKSLAIIYPTFNRDNLSHEEPDKIWHTQIAPPVGFTEYKALQKIEKTVRIIGFRDYAIYSTANSPPEWRSMNRVWICLPRNPQGLSQISQYYSNSKFRIIPRKGNSEGKILWRYSADAKHFIHIKSPFSRYIQMQRKDMPGGEWKSQMEKIIAKDFGILARFSDKTNPEPMASGTLKDYLVAGIRGLGTWGAAWFIDRRYSNFDMFKNKDDENLEYLLEVTYVDGRIFEVIDVSQETESYFKAQYANYTIKRTINRYQQGVFDQTRNQTLYQEGICNSDLIGSK